MMQSWIDRVTSSRDADGPLTWVLAATWFGLAAGLAELAVVAGRALLIPGDGYRRSPHFIWMVPVAGMAVFVVWGLLLRVLIRPIPKVGRVLPDYLLWTLGFLVPMLAIPGLGSVSCLVLAVGLACWAAPLLRSHTARFRRLALLSLPVMSTGVLVLVGVAFGRHLLTTRGVAPRGPGARPDAPNVLLVVMDTVRADAMSLYGHGRDTTPNLTALARRGARFERAIAPAPWTLPSHASMFTGRWARELSVGSDRPLDARYPTLAEYLRRHGYATAGFVANTFLCGAEHGLGRGFEHYEDHVISPLVVLRSSALGWLICKDLRSALDRVYPALGLAPRHPLEVDFYRKDAARINRDALSWVAGHGDRPFFVFLNYYDAHDPYLVPEGSSPRFGRRPRSLAEFQVLRDWTPQEPRARGAEEVVLARDAYDDCIAYLDGQLGRLFAGLDRLGRLDNTVVIVTADHGEHFGEHRRGGRPLFGHAASLYQPEIHVPLLIVAPGRVPPGTVARGPASLRDLPATVVDLLGLEGGSPFPGHSLAGSGRAGPPGGRNALSEFDPRTDIPTDPRFLGSNPGFMRAVVGDRTVLHEQVGGREELYDLSDDPGELHDLAGDEGSRRDLEQTREALERLAPLGARTR